MKTNKISFDSKRYLKKIKRFKGHVVGDTIIDSIQEQIL